MNLVIDIGNTLCKIAIFMEDEELLFYTAVTKLKTDDILLVLEKYPVKHAILSSVAETYSEIETILKSHTHYVHFSHTTKLPITIQYNSLSTLGLDRIANAVAAACFFPKKNVLSIQAGSCLVFDFIDQEAHFQGGAIAPGLSMRFRALHHFTKRLPLLEKSDNPPLIGKDTQQSIQSGVINGIIHEINETIRQYQRHYSDLQILLSGGDSIYLQNSIKNAIFADSKFVLKGLHKILMLNVEK
jgi:type III pantothenate kinase